MAVTLPTFADVGINDPRSVGTQPTYPTNDAVAEGEATLGKGIEKVGGAVEDYAADQQRKKAKLEQALATTDLFNRLTPLQEQIAHETDPAKLADLRSQYDQILPTSGTGISDPYARQLWEATHAKTIFHAKAEADARNTVLDRNGILAQVQGQVDQAVRTGAAADDPQAFENAKLAVRNSYDYLGKYGAALPTQVLELNKKAQLDLVAGRIDSLIAKGRVDEASSLLEQNRNDLGAVAAGNMEIRLKKAGDAALGAQIFQRSGGEGGPAPVSGDLSDRIIGAESGGRNVANPRSSAAGPGQFIDSTWLSMVKSQAPDVAAGKSDAQILALKGNKDLSRQMTAAYAGQNKQYLAGQGLPTDDGALYLAHFLGAGGAAKVLSADPATPMSQIVSQDVLSANPNIAGKTAGDVRQLTASRVGAIPIPTGAQAAQSTGGTATQPPGIAAPGVGDIAAMQQIADQQYAQRLERITADPAAISNPVAFDHASKLAEHEYRRKTLVLTGQMKALTEARNDAATGYVREAMQPGGAPVDMLDRMAADKRLDAPTLENLWSLVEKHQKHTVAGDLVTYGPKFFEAYGRLTLDDNDSQKLRDPSQIYAMAQPPKDGSTPDLTLQGVQKLTQSMDELKKRDPALAERKKEFMQLIMPMDRAAEEYSLPQRQQRYNMSWDIDQHIAHLKPGQNPNDLFDSTKPDYLGKPYQAQIDANALARKIQGDPAMKTQDGIAAAYRAGKITKDQAAEALTHLGIKFLDAQSAPPALAPPVAVP